MTVEIYAGIPEPESLARARDTIHDRLLFLMILRLGGDVKFTADEILGAEATRLLAHPDGSTTVNTASGKVYRWKIDATSEGVKILCVEGGPLI